MATLLSTYLVLGGAITIVCCLQISLPSGYSSPETRPIKQRYQYFNLVQWSCFNSTAEDYNCCDIGPNQIECHESGPLLIFGHCATYDEGKLAISPCYHYFLPNSYRNVTVPGYISLPIRITEYNDSMCRQMNRKGFVCSKCVDGYGPSVTSYGYKCVRCPHAWYRILLFLIFELFHSLCFMSSS